MSWLAVGCPRWNYYVVQSVFFLFQFFSMHCCKCLFWINNPLIYDKRHADQWMEFNKSIKNRIECVGGRHHSINSSEEKICVKYYEINMSLTIVWLMSNIFFCFIFEKLFNWFAEIYFVNFVFIFQTSLSSIYLFSYFFVFFFHFGFYWFHFVERKFCVRQSIWHMATSIYSIQRTHNTATVYQHANPFGKAKIAFHKTFYA